MGRPPRVTRDQVLSEARRAFAERGFEGTTLASIGARLGVSPAALLRHAHSKEELFSLAMECESESEPLPGEPLETASSENPEKVLREFALTLVPFLERKMGESIARFLRDGSAQEARTIRLPFDPRRKGSPPTRLVAGLERYLQRARAAGRLSVRDPRAAALAFIGSLHSFVFFHRVLRLDPPMPFEGYLRTLFQIWKRGAFGGERRKR